MLALPQAPGKKSMRTITTAAALLLACATWLPQQAHAACDSPYGESPQFDAQDCTFRNPPNPDLKPHRSSWDIWTRFLVA